DVADAGEDTCVDETEPTAGDGVGAGEDLGAIADGLTPGGEDVVGGAAAAVELAEAGLTAEEPDAVEQVGPGDDVEAGLGRGVDHAVVGDHQDPYGGRQGLAQLLELQVDGGELVAPLPG